MTGRFEKEELVDEYGDNHLSFHLDKQTTLQQTGQRITTPKREELSVKGNAKNSYITIISANYLSGNKKLLIETGAILAQFGKAELDILPLDLKKDLGLKPGYSVAEFDEKTKAAEKDLWLEAGYNAAALAEKSTQGGRRNILILTERAKGDLFLNSVENYYTAKLKNGVNIITDNEKTLYFVKDKIAGDINVYPRSVNPNLKISEAGELEVSAVVAKHKVLVPKEVWDNLKDEVVIQKQKFGNTVSVSESGDVVKSGPETVYEKYKQILTTNETINNLELMQAANKFIESKTPATGIEKIRKSPAMQVQVGAIVGGGSSN